MRNWDYRFCWLRDATFTLYALLQGGHTDEACAWRDWLLRAVAGDPAKLQIMYGVAGERRLEELELPWLPGYEGSAPVRVGNAAFAQFQLDVYGELIDAMHQARCAGIDRRASIGWKLAARGPEISRNRVARAGRRHLGSARPAPAFHALEGDGVGRVRSRGARLSSSSDCEGPVECWRGHRDELRAEICARGFNRKKGAFTQEYGGEELDASLLMLPLVGFLPPEDERVRGTVAAIERELLVDGFVLRYRTDEAAEVDGLPGREGAFLLCTFWLADNYVLAGRRDEARAALRAPARDPQRPRPARRSNTTRAPAACSAISRKPSPTSASSTPRAISPQDAAPRSSGAKARAIRRHAEVSISPRTPDFRAEARRPRECAV